MPDLPYGYDALEPHISSKTLEFHHDKHAYYLDYQNGRANYAEAFLNDLINWAFVAEQLNMAKQTA
ncbi:MAG: Fe-Mn family superoxide dismutase [Synechococcales bacterium]|nr:Fe-Mn family superoxide dismutase [Synechococcales bacterium]